MNARIVELETSLHQKVQKLLAWEVTQRLSAGEHDMVVDHLASCAQCREDLAFQRRLCEVQPAAGAAPDMDAALAALLPKLEPHAPVRRPMSSLSQRLFGGEHALMRAALAAQVLLIAGLALLLLREPDQYHLLGNAPTQAASANLVVVFRPETSEHELRATLAANGATVVGGPTATRAWLLSVPPSQLAVALDSLRHQGAVEMAEPLQAPR